MEAVFPTFRDVAHDYSDTTITRGLAANEASLRLKAAREARQWTQAQLAKALGWGAEKQNRISQYERGERDISLDVAEELGRVFDVPGVWFTGLISRKEAMIIGLERNNDGPVVEPAKRSHKIGIHDDGTEKRTHRRR
jgi:transcriptional regulator with XRE-family HTH domain